jgi:anti-sigma B factor antagonist
MRSYEQRYSYSLPALAGSKRSDRDLLSTRPSSRASRYARTSVQGDFQVDVRRAGTAELIEVRGELDLASGPRLEEELSKVSVADTKLVVVDLRRLEFMDSTGLSIIVRAHQRLAEDGCELSLVRGSPQVQRLLDLTGVAERLRLVAAPEELLNGN